MCLKKLLKYNVTKCRFCDRLKSSYFYAINIRSIYLLVRTKKIIRSFALASPPCQGRNIQTKTQLFKATFITGNVHIGHSRGDPACGVTPSMQHCAAAVHPAVRSPQRTLSIWQLLACRSLSIWVKCSQL